MVGTEQATPATYRQITWVVSAKFAGGVSSSVPCGRPAFDDSARPREAALCPPPCLAAGSRRKGMYVHHCHVSGIVLLGGPGGVDGRCGGLGGHDPALVWKRQRGTGNTVRSPHDGRGKTASGGRGFGR